jgi:hypothetical protein
MTDVSVVKAKLKPPAIAIIVNAVIGIAACLFMLMLFSDIPINYESQRIMLMAWNTFLILAFPALAFSIYGALQMMNARKYGFAMTSAIITILFGFIIMIGFPIGIWALIVLLKHENKSAFTA